MANELLINKFEDPAKVKLPELFKMIDEKRCDLIKLLKAAVAIPSVSHEPEHLPDIVKMLNFCKEELKSLGAKVELIEIGKKNEIPMPPVLIASFIINQELRTICVYGYVDMPPLKKSESNDLNPFQLTEKKEKLYRCGVSENKETLLCWFNALEVYKMAKIEMPVNIKFVIEGTAESHSSSLKQAVQIKPEFFSNIEFVCLTIDVRLKELPCLKYGFRGTCHFSLNINCGNKKVHSGRHGGAFQQPLMDAIHFLGSLFDKNGKLSIPELLEKVAPLPPEEENFCQEVHINVQKLKEEIGTKRLKHKEKDTRLLMHTTRLPSFSVHNFDMDIDYNEKNKLAMVPNSIRAKFSIRLVPNQTAQVTHQIIDKYIQKFWKKSGNVNSYILNMDLGYDPWRQDPSGFLYKAAANAIKTVYSTIPIYVCEGYTMPAVSIMTEACFGSELVVLPISCPSRIIHSNKESIPFINYINGIKLIIAYMCEIHDMQ